MKKHIKYIVAVIVVILIIVLLVTLNIKRNNQKKEESNITKIVTSFYPMYIMAENLTDGASNVELENMADVNVGCLHDYTLMTEDIKKVENADIFISNGLGMESFINKLIEANSNMKIIDSSKSITNVIKSEEETNPHIWTSIDNYILQVQTISDSLKEYNAENSEVYEKNAEKYVEELTELKNKYNTDYNIKKAIEKREVYKLEKGLYSNKEYVNPLVLYSKKYPKAIITMDSAFYFYELTDVIPQKVYLATDSHARKIESENIVQLFVDGKILNEGKVTEKIEDEYVNIYDKERLLVELIRKRNQISFDYYKELISSYRESGDKLDMYKIEKYLALYKNEVNLSNALLREVF